MNFYILFCFFLFLVIFLVFAKKFSKTQSYLSTFVFFGISGLFYYFTIPLEFIITGDRNIFLSKIGLIEISSNSTIAFCTMAVLGLLGFGLGLHKSRFNPFKFNNQKTSKHFSKELFLMLIFFVTLILFFFKKHVISSGTYAGNVETSYNNPIYVLLVNWSILICSLYSGFIILTKKRITIFSILLVLPGVFWSLYASTKEPIITSCLTLSLYYICLKPPKKVIRLFFLLLVVMLATPLFLKWFSLFRSGVEINFNSIYYFFDSGVFRHSDPAGPFVVFNEIYISTKEFQFGSTYLESFYLLIPKFLWASRPLDIAESFGSNVIVNWNQGEGLGFSLLAEAYLNFGILGSLIQYFVIGFVWGKFWEFIKNILVKYSPYLWLSLYHIFGILLIIMLHRAQSSFVTKELFVTITPLITIAYLLRAMLLPIKSV